MFCAFQLDGGAVHLQPHRPAKPLVEAEDRPQEFRSTGTGQPRDAEDFAPPTLEADGVWQGGGAQVLHGQMHRQVGHRVPFTGLEIRIDTCHFPNQGRLGKLAAAPRQAHLAIAQHRYLVAHVEHVPQAVRDVDHGHSGIRLFAQDFVQPLRLRCGEGGGGFVQHQQGGARGEGSGNLHKLLFGETQPADSRGRARMCETHACQRLQSAFVRRLAADASRRRRGGEQQIVGDGEIVDEAQFLRAQGDAGLERLGCAARPIGRTGERQRSGVRLFETHHDPGQGGLAGAVFAHEAVNGAGCDGQVHIPQHLGCEGLADARHGDGGRGSLATPWFGGVRDRG